MSALKITAWRVLGVVAVLWVAVLPVAADTISIQPATSIVALGQTFTVSIAVSDASDLYAYQFDVGFDPAVLAALSVDEGPFLTSGGETTFFFPGDIENSLGIISFTAGNLIGSVPGIAGSGVLAELSFLATGPGASSITLSNVVLLDSNLNDITAVAEAGNVTVTAVPEPASALLMGSGLAIWIALRRRSRRRNSKAAAAIN